MYRNLSELKSHVLCVSPVVALVSSPISNLVMYQTFVSIVDLRLAVLKTGICRRSGGYHLNLSKKSRVLCVSPVVALISSPISNLVMYQTFVSIVDLRLAV